MIYNFIDISKPLEFNSIGKFQDTSPDYMHADRPLSNFELIVMTKGALYLKKGDTKYAVSEGQYLFLYPKEGERRKGYRPSPAEYYWMHFSCNSHLLVENPSPNDFISTDHSLYLPSQADLLAPEKVLLLMRMLQDHRRSKYLSSLDYANYLTTLILCEIYQQYISQMRSDSKTVKSLSAADPEKGKPARHSSSSILYSDMSDYIRLNLHKNLKIQDIADHFGYNAKHLSLICKEYSGFTLKHYMMKLKIEQAQFLLLDTNDSVQQISASLGFPDSHNFSRTFKAVTGMTPSECRTLYGRKILNQ